MDDQAFAARIRARYPEGLTAIIPIGGTRTTYILERNRNADDPGHIEDMRAYGDDLALRIQGLIRTYIDLGGQHLIMPILAYQLLEDERGEQYAEMASKMALDLLNEQWVQFYRQNDIDPYFVGIDTLLHFPDRPYSYRLGTECTSFHQHWRYEEGHHKLVWEIAPIPLYSLWRTDAMMDEKTRSHLEAQINSAPDMDSMYDILYKFYAQAVYGTEIPKPHFYLGSNRSGEMRLRAMLPIALACGGPMRFFFLPYASVLTSRATLELILEDLAFGKRLRSSAIDYSGKLQPELVNREYERIHSLVNDPSTTLGMLRAHDADAKS